MKKTKNQAVIIIALTTVLSALALVSVAGQSKEVATRGAGLSTPATVTVFATGLNNPRGLKFGPGGNLYVAEGGTGGSNSTEGCCEQVIPDTGPYTGSVTGSRISKINANGVVTTAVDNLPSSQTSADIGSLISGAADVAFIGNTLYVLLGGAGCSHGVPQVPEMPNGVIRVNADGTLDLIANLSAFVMANPVQNPNPPDFEPDGTWYSMIAARGDGSRGLYAVEPNHGELDRITPDGQISRVIDISASQGHIVPTAVAFDGVNFFVGNLGVFPIVDGSEYILKITPSGQVRIFATGFTTILGLAFDSHGKLYVLENTTGGNPVPTPGTGKILRLHSDGTSDEIATGLNLPTAMTFGPDGAIYVSSWGFGGALGMGEIDKVTLP